ncbi:hypothetical protein PDO_2279 [Rhizobium sp. PDO1-076]|nr:hypothetical protein PDO_2279 [Rhizobium sp. PDO1-076]
MIAGHVGVGLMEEFPSGMTPSRRTGFGPVCKIMQAV